MLLPAQVKRDRRTIEEIQEDIKQKKNTASSVEDNLSSF
jgi:hypothetical protein